MISPGRAKEVFSMYDMTKGMASAARLSGSAVGLNMQRSVRGRAEEFSMEPLTLAVATRRSGARLAAGGRGCDSRMGGARRCARAM